MLLLRRGFPQQAPFSGQAFVIKSTPSAFQAFSSSPKKVDLPPMLAANVYVSEGRDQTLIDRFSKAANSAVPYASLCHVFQDEKYHRTGFTLAGTPAALTAAVYALTKKALEQIDLRAHIDVTHPRTGVVDHVVFHPLPGASDLHLASSTAVEFAHQVGEGCKVPVYLYGAASDSRRPLAELRRGLGYFKGAKQGIWSGVLHESNHALPSETSSNQLSNPSANHMSNPSSNQLTNSSFPCTPLSASKHVTITPSIPPDTLNPLPTSKVPAQETASTSIPPPTLPPSTKPNHFSETSKVQLPPPDISSFEGFDKSGVVCVGATPWVVNYNVPLECADISQARQVADADISQACQVANADISEARQVARLVSERGGGLSGVQAMALPHSPGVIEIACNLLDAEAVSPATVQAFVERQAAGRGFIVKQGYLTGLKPEDILASAREKLGFRKL